MKNFLLSVLFSLTACGAYAQSADTLKPRPFNDDEFEFLEKTEGYLRSGFRFTTAVNSMVIIGGGLFCADLIDGDLGGLGVVGFEIGFGGVEMSKFSPMALVKARRNFSELRQVWPDSVSYASIMSSIQLAENLSKVSVISVFLSEGLIVAGLMQQDMSLRRLMVGSGFVMGGLALGTSIATTVITQKTRIELGRSSGSIEFGAGTSGIGAFYRLP